MFEENKVPAAQDKNETAQVQQQAPAAKPAEKAAVEVPDVTTPQQQGNGQDPLDSIIKKEQADKEKAAADPIGKNGILGGDDETAKPGEKQDKDAAGEKKDDGKAADPYQPFKYPDGFIEDAEAMGDFKKIAGEYGLKQEQAQKMVDVYSKIEMRKKADEAAFIEKNNAEWSGEIRTHSEFGGANLKETAERVNAMVRQYGSPLLMAQIRQMNLQHWPELTYMLARIHKSMAEDTSLGGEKGKRELSAKDFFEVD